MDNDKVILRSYNKVWNYEVKIYALDSLKLPIPIFPREAIYFILGLIITMLLLKVMPFLNAIPFILRYTLLPYGIMKFFTKKKFDGKLPHMFLKSYFDYLKLPKSMSRFQGENQLKKGHFTPVVYRELQVINLTEKLMKKGKKRNDI